jgi:hypothetical protein
MLDPWSEKRLRELYHWFNTHLTAPELERRYCRAAFWFRSKCGEMVDRIWELVHLLQDNGVAVDFIHTANPGYICYQDRHQIAAIPFRDRHLRL